jgi:hypothetical protein
MRGLNKNKYSKAIATVLTVLILTALIGTRSFASAAGTDAVSDRGAVSSPDTNPSEAPQAMPDGADVTAYGADGRDADDDTDAIQAALDRHDSVYIPDGTYYIDVDKALCIRSGQSLTLGENAVLQAIPTSSSLNSIIEITDVENVTVTGGTIIGDRADHTGSEGEWGMGIFILDSSDVVVRNVAVSDCWGDGVYIGGTTPSSGIVIDGVTSDSNRRQGLSVTNAVGVEITNCVFTNTSGTAPSAGIDIEPNAGETVENITVSNTVCANNEGAGLDIVGWSEHIENITVSDCTLSENGGSGLRVVNAGHLHFSHTAVIGNETGIELPRDATDVEFIDVSVDGNSLRGVSLVTTSQTSGTSDIVFESCAFTNNSQTSAGEYDGIRIDNYDQSGTIRDVTFVDCRFADNQTSKTQRFGLTVGYSDGIYGVVVERSCEFSGNVAGAYVGGNALAVL